MSGYTKLFSSIVASTVWNEDNDTRIVWITMLALADRHGRVEGSVPGLAVLARVSVDGCRAAITKLSNPDPDSRSQFKEGRRIEATPGGWQIVNHEEYRRKLSEDDRREYQRQWMADKRAREQSVDTRGQALTNVDDVDTSRVQKQKQKQSTEADTKDSTARAARFARFYDAYPRKKAPKKALLAFKAIDPSDTLLDTMLEAIAKQKRSKQWQDKQFIPFPATWLNQKRWEDEPDVAAATAMPTYDDSWCQHDPRCSCLEVHQLQLIRDREAKGA